MVYDKTRMRMGSDKKKEMLDKIKQMIARPSVSALMYGYLKEQDVNLKDMSVDEWKRIEMDLVDILLGETFPGEEASEDQLNFTAVANSIAFMTDLIAAVTEKIGDGAAKESEKTEKEAPNADEGPTFEL